MAKKDKKHVKEYQTSVSTKTRASPKGKTSENTRFEVQMDATGVGQRKSLAPVFVPNKFMSGFETYSETVRNGPAALKPSRSKLNMIVAQEKFEAMRGLETKGSNLEGFTAEPLTYRPSRPSPQSCSASSSIPSVEKLSSEELLPPKKQSSFLPKIQNSSKSSIPRLTIKEKYIPAGAPSSTALSPSNFVQESSEIRILPQTKMGSVSLLSQRQQAQPCLVRKQSNGEVTNPNADKPNQLKLPVPPSLPKPKELLSVNTTNIRHRKIKIRQRSDSFNVKNK